MTRYASGGHGHPFLAEWRAQKAERDAAAREAARERRALILGAIVVWGLIGLALYLSFRGG